MPVVLAPQDSLNLWDSSLSAAHLSPAEEVPKPISNYLTAAFYKGIKADRRDTPRYTLSHSGNMDQSWEPSLGHIESWAAASPSFSPFPTEHLLYTHKIEKKNEWIVKKQNMSLSWTATKDNVQPQKVCFE